ncbi:carnosic acid synthase isoform X1 [Gossypium raimondii]|uniref:carnosic acid synthase isoform X1 n=1 Tax=Gossypium raimondii TaxID=29730 RepID=UPI00227D3463|nr:carnosic acid synthase isoform X1 [Gossypium raimondii]
MLQTAYTLYPWLLDLSKPKDGLFRAILSFVMVILAISLWHLWFVKKSKKIVAQLPPGPRGLPIVGYLPFLGTDNLHLSFTELAATYGPSFKLWLGNKLCVVISSPELAKEVVRDHDVTFSERDPPIAAQVASFGCNDISFDSYSNPRWKNKRKVLATELLTNARLNACYGLRREQVMNGLKDVYENVGKPIDIGKWTYLVALNAAISMILGGELPGEKGAAIEGNLKENSSESMVLMGKPNVSDIFPAIARFDIQGIERRMRKISQQFNRLLESVIEMAIDKEKDKKSSEQKLGFLELLLHLERNNNEDNASPLTMDEVKGLLVDILVGGTDTTTTMVEWTMAVLMQHPEIMEKVKKELSDVVGVNNTVEEYHLSNLSYLNAVIKETFRLHPALPLLVPRCPARSVHLNGYTIPKGSRLFINMWCIHRDPLIWENPLEFRPERFLNDPDNSNHYGNDFRFMPFGSGRRKCPGIPLEEKLLFFILASLLHSFEWRLPHGTVLDMSSKFGIVMKKKEPTLLIPAPRLTNLDANG